MIENKTFDEIRVGETASMVRAFRRDDVETWAAVTGDLNLIDLDPSSVDSSMFPYGAGQAMWAGALFSTIGRGYPDWAPSPPLPKFAPGADRPTADRDRHGEGKAGGDAHD